ncbi:MAG: hypothetical protein ACLFVB_08310 [Thermoplasmata archaeon]
MGFWNLFRGYVFFKLLGLGVTLIIVGVVISIMTLLEGEGFGLMFCSIPVILIGSGVLVVVYRMYKKDVRKSKSTDLDSTPIGYSRSLEKEKCPKCGNVELEVYNDGAAVCNYCGYSDMDYSNKKE